jgi:hypothetical protein
MKSAQWTGTTRQADHEIVSPFNLPAKENLVRTIFLETAYAGATTGICSRRRCHAPFGQSSGAQEIDFNPRDEHEYSAAARRSSLS